MKLSNLSHPNNPKFLQETSEWDKEEQIKKNQKAIEHFKNKLEKAGNMTEEEIEQSQEELELLQEIIQNSR